MKKGMSYTLRLGIQHQKEMSIAQIMNVRERLKRAVESDDFLYEAKFIMSYAKEIEDAVGNLRKAEEKLNMLDLIEGAEEEEA